MYCHLSNSFINIFIFVFIIQIGFVFNLNNETVASPQIKTGVRMTTNYMDELVSSSSLSFVRPNGDTNKLYYYHMISVKVLMTGVYSFTSKSEIETYGSFHDGAVNLSNPSTSMIASTDDSGGHGQFQINLDLQSYKKYILLVSTYHPNVAGKFTIVAEGPTSVVLTQNFNFIWGPTIPTITSTYSGSLSSNSPSFSRSSNNINNYYYQAIEIRLPMGGRYMFMSSSTMDTYGFFYTDLFDPSYPSKDLISSNDDSNDDNQFRLVVTLQSEQKYILVVTTFRQNATGNFLIKVVGPTSVDLTSTGPVTSRYNDALSYSSSTFSRPNSNADIGCYYYQAIRIRASKDGSYTFSSISSMDTYGYFYNDSFDPFYPSKNLIASNDDSEGDGQFRIYVTLQSEQKYILVVTTFRQNATGNFLIKVVGPASVDLTSTGSVTSRYNDALSYSSSTFSRPNSNADIGGHYYQAIRIRASKNGSYTFSSISSMDTYGYFYNDSFDPFYPSKNLIASNDDSEGDGQFRIYVTLKSEQQYILVVTTFRQNITGDFLIKVVGSASVNLTSTGPVTSRHNDVLSCNSSIFSRYNWNSETGCYYYQAIRIRASKDGSYNFVSSSSMDTYGYLYNNSFDPSRPSQNLITSNDDDGANRQFQLHTTLQSHQTYILVVTTSREDIRGSFQITAVGTSWIFFCSIAPTTDHQLCASCIIPYLPIDNNNTSSKKKVIAIVVPICSVFILIVICCCVRRCRRKKKSNQIVRTRRSSQTRAQRNATTTNEIDVPFTIPLSRVFNSFEEQPPPYTSIIPYSRA